MIAVCLYIVNSYDLYETPAVNPDSLIESVVLCCAVLCWTLSYATLKRVEQGSKVPPLNYPLPATIIFIMIPLELFIISTVVKAPPTRYQTAHK